MAQIITYPELSTLANNDLLIVSDVSAPNKPTKSLKIDTLAKHIIVENDIVTACNTQGPTIGTIPQWCGKSNPKLNDSGYGIEPMDVVFDAKSNVVTYRVGPSGLLSNKLIFNGAGLTANNLTSRAGNTFEALGDSVIGTSSSDDLRVIASSIFISPVAFENTAPATFKSTADFTAAVTFDSVINDNTGGPGTAGQVLSSTGTGVQWKNDTDTDTTYDLTGAATNVDDYKVVLTGSDGTVDNVVFEAGTGITLADQGGSTVQIQATNNGTVTGTGTPNTLTMWNAAGTGIEDSTVSQLGTEITIPGDLMVGAIGNSIGGTNDLIAGQDNSVVGNFSVAFGFNNSITGNRSGGLGANNIVAGGQVWATGDGNNVGINVLNVGGNIVTSGFNNTVKSGNSCVVGTNNNLTNTTQATSISTNFAFGSDNLLSDVADGVAVGFNNTINTDDGCVVGRNNTTNAIDTYAVGKSNTLSSVNDYAFGLNNTLSGSANIAMALGHNNELSGSQSYTFGRNLSDGGQNDTVMIGRFNAVPTATGRIVFGTGFSNTGRKNAIEIQAGNNAQSGLLFPALRLSSSYINDAAAATAGVERGELYRANNQVKINLDQTQQDARNNEGFIFLTPRVKIISSGEIFNYDSNYNLLKLSWSGGGNTAGVVLPSAFGVASFSTNRVLSILTDTTMGGKTINITSTAGTINGLTTKTITGAYVSIKFWSDGTEWFILNQLN